MSSELFLRCTVSVPPQTPLLSRHSPVGISTTVDSTALHLTPGMDVTGHWDRAGLRLVWIGWVGSGTCGAILSRQQHCTERMEVASVCLSVCLSVCMYVCLSACLCLSVSLVPVLVRRCRRSGETHPTSTACFDPAVHSPSLWYCIVLYCIVFGSFCRSVDNPTNSPSQTRPLASGLIGHRKEPHRPRAQPGDWGR